MRTNTIVAHEKKLYEQQATESNNKKRKLPNMQWSEYMFNECDTVTNNWTTTTTKWTYLRCTQTNRSGSIPLSTHNNNVNISNSTILVCCFGAGSITRNTHQFQVNVLTEKERVRLLALCGTVYAHQTKHVCCDANKIRIRAPRSRFSIMVDLSSRLLVIY